MIDYLLFRPLTLLDLESLYDFSILSKGSLTSLPQNKSRLTKMIQKSVHSFQKTVDSPDDEIYLFGLEDIRTRRVVGVSALNAYAAASQPLHFFKFIKSNGEIFLRLSSGYSYTSQLSTLYLHPMYRTKGVGRFLSYARFLFMLLNRDRFFDDITVEMRGFRTKSGKSLFFNWLIKPFLKMTLREADDQYLNGVNLIKNFPKEDIYFNALDLKLQNTCGQTHVNTTPALKLLKQSGFSYINGIDVFDGGPKLKANLFDIPAVKQAKRVSSLSDIASFSNQLMLACYGNGVSFKAGVYHPKTNMNSDIIKTYFTGLSHAFVTPLYPDLLRDIQKNLTQKSFQDQFLLQLFNKTTLISE